MSAKSLLFFSHREIALVAFKMRRIVQGQKKKEWLAVVFQFINFISHAFSCVYSERWDFFLLVIRAFEQRNLLFRCSDEFNTPAYPPLLNLGTTLWWVLIPEALFDWFSLLGALDANSCKTGHKKRIIPHPASHSAWFLHSHQLVYGCSEGIFHRGARDRNNNLLQSSAADSSGLWAPGSHRVLPSHLPSKGWSGHRAALCPRDTISTCLERFLLLERAAVVPQSVLNLERAKPDPHGRSSCLRGAL